MIAKIYIDGEIGTDVDLLGVMTQYKNFSNPEKLEVHINSNGGSVKVGNDIYNFLKNLQIPVTTIATKAYSIAASIFMAGDERVVERGKDAIMIHFPFVMGFTGRADDMEKMGRKLKDLEDEMIEFYSNHLPSIDKTTISNLLGNETFLSGDEAYSLGFATALEVPLAAVAYFEDKPKISINNKSSIMTKFDELIEAIKGFKISGSSESSNNEATEPKALVLQDANGTEINFPDVAEDAMPEVGDDATVDGAPAEGEFIATDGSKWIFTAGKLSEIIPAEVEESENPEAMEVKDEETLEPFMSQEELEKVLEQLFAKTATDTMDEIIALYDAKLAKIESDNKAEITALRKLIGSPEHEESKHENININKNKGNSLAQLLRG